MKPGFLETVKMMVMDTTKIVATEDNKNLVYGVMRLRGNSHIYKPIPIRPPVLSYNEAHILKKRKR